MLTCCVLPPELSLLGIVQVVVVVGLLLLLLLVAAAASAGGDCNAAAASRSKPTKSCLLGAAPVMLEHAAIYNIK